MSTRASRLMGAAVLLIALTLLLGCVVSAQAATSANVFTYTQPSNGNVTITGFADKTNYPTTIEIPQTSPDGYKVTGIGENAFNGCDKLASVTIPGSVESIGANAFAKCSLLRSLTLSEGLKSIKGTVNYTNGAFHDCAKLTSVVIPSTVTSIGNCAFYNCKLLSSVTFLPSADYQMSIGTSAFYGTSLAGALSIPAKVKSIEAGAFAGTPISSLTIEGGAYLKTISSGAFKDCESLATVTIPGNVENINESAFANCALLRSLTLSEGLQYIGGTTNYTNGAFHDCAKLTSVVIPSTVTKIDNRAFYNCKLLSSVAFLPSADYQMSIGSSAFEGTALGGALTIPAKVKSIGGSAFAGTPITSLSIEAGAYLETISASAFKGCASLASVTIPGNVKNINESAFANCALLRSLTLSEGLQYIGGTTNYTNGAFHDCTKLTSVVIPSTVTEIDNRAFYNCSSLTSLTILPSADYEVSIGAGAFEKTALSGALTIPAKVKGISAAAFAGTPITSLSIERGAYLTTISDSAFKGCKNLTTVTIPGNVQNINENAFANCTSLVSLNLSRGLKYIGGTTNYINGAFHDCTSLPRVTIPGTVTKIDNRGFYGCSSLSEIIIQTSQDEISIGYEAFKGCPGTPVFAVEQTMFPVDFTGFDYYDGGLFFASSGSVVSDANGLVQDPNSPSVWYFCANGQAQLFYTGLAEYGGQWFYLENGICDTTRTDVVSYDGGLFIVSAGRLLQEYSGLIQNPTDGLWYFVSQGQVQAQYSGLQLYDGSWFYVIAGRLAVDYSGPVDYDGATFNVVAGMVQ